MIEYKAVQKSVSLDWKTGRRLVTFEMLEGCTDDALNACDGRELKMSVSPWKRGRSRDANSMYWSLLGQLAAKVGFSRPEMHNALLARYGVDETVEGQQVVLVLPDTEEAAQKAAQAESYHIRPTSSAREVGGQRYRTYVLMKGSHEYDTQEFSNLLNGLISECQEQGIPTSTPEQLARMMAAYEANYRRRHGVDPTG